MGTVDEIGPERIRHAYNPVTGITAAIDVDITGFDRANDEIPMPPDITTIVISA